MDLQQLRYIIALYEEKHFGRAAKKVGISQPTLSQQIKKLEDELQVILFERSKKQIRLTEAGKTFIPYALAAIKDLKQGIATLKNQSESLTDEIKLGFIPTIGPYLLPKILKEIKSKAPKLKLKLFEETTSVLLENLKAGKFDLGLVALPLLDPQISSQEIGSEEFLLAIPAKSALAKEHPKSISVNNVKKNQLLMLKEGHCFRDQSLDFCHISSGDPRLIFEGSSLTSVLNLVAAGEGITFVPKMAAKSHANQHIKYITFSGKKPKRSIGLIWRHTSALSHSQEFLLDSLTGTLKN